MRSWTLELATYPKQADAKDDNEAIHAHLTASGREKLKAAKEAKGKADMKPGEDYIVKDTGSHKYSWFPFYDNDYTRQYHNLYIKHDHMVQCSLLALCFEAVLDTKITMQPSL